MARWLARKHGISAAYANEVLRLLTSFKRGQFSEDACVREAHRLGE
jgi:hypothetical protein